MTKTRAFLPALLFLALGNAGCGPDEKEYEYHSGKVQVQADGIALDGGLIEFLPRGDTNFIATGEIATDGSVQLKTLLNRPTKEVSGVPVGEYQVSIRTASMHRGAVTPISVSGFVAVRAEDPTILVKVKKPSQK